MTEQTWEDQLTELERALEAIRWVERIQAHVNPGSAAGIMLAECLSETVCESDSLLRNVTPRLITIARIEGQQSQRANSLQATLLEYICREGEKDAEIVQLRALLEQMTERHAVAGAALNIETAKLAEKDAKIARMEEIAKAAQSMAEVLEEGISESPLGMVDLATAHGALEAYRKAVTESGRLEKPNDGR